MTAPLVVAGAFGTLGRRLIAALHERGTAVVGLDLPTPARAAIAQHVGRRGASEVARTDLTAAVAEAVDPARPKAVLHPAGASGIEPEPDVT